MWPLLLNEVLLFCCFVLCDVVSVVGLPTVIVWLNSDFCNVSVGIDVCEVVYMVLYMAWDSSVCSMSKAAIKHNLSQMFICCCSTS